MHGLILISFLLLAGCIEKASAGSLSTLGFAPLIYRLSPYQIRFLALNKSHIYPLGFSVIGRNNKKLFN